MNPNGFTPTNDKVIRTALIKKLNEHYYGRPDTEIIEELGIQHGEVRVDVAVVNGIIHGYELKSDKDTFCRLPEQMNIYNKVFDKITLVVGKSHLCEAMYFVPDWWGITLAKIVSSKNDVQLISIREPNFNKVQDNSTIVKLLWRNEALSILKEHNAVKGMYSKKREVIYEKLNSLLDLTELKEIVRIKIRDRLLKKVWRFDPKLKIYGD